MEEKVYKLRKALYGLKQAPRAWYSRIDAYFLENGFHISKNEPTLYIKVKGKDILIVSLYVDDMIYTGSSCSLIEEFKVRMMNEFEMTDLGLLHYFLGLEIKQTQNRIFLSQEKYAYGLLKKFNMENCKGCSTPMNAGEKLCLEDGTGKVDATYFRKLIGGLMYLTHTRPDVMFAVYLVSRFMHNPSKHHLGAAKRILRYIHGTIDFGIWYFSVTNFKLTGFTDSDWAGSLDDRKSTSGYCFTLGSGIISWTSKKQATTALSSSEAEYIAATSTACQAIWIRRVLEDLHQTQLDATTIFCDNKSTISMTNNPTFHGRTKHIGIRHHFIREIVVEGLVDLHHCSTNIQVADIMTKALSYEKFSHFRELLGVNSFASRGSVGN